MDCKFCGNKFSGKTSLKHHQKTAKYCLKLQGVKTKKYVCNSCGKNVSTKHRLATHYQSCSVYKQEHYKIEFKAEKQQLLDKIQELECIIIEKNKHIENLEDKLENIAIERKAVQRPFEEETTIEIDDTLSDGDFIVEDSEYDEEYELQPLEVGKGYTIEYRDEDGYVNVTNLCKAGGKKFADWKRLNKTKAFLQVLSNDMQIHISLLIKVQTGYGSNQSTWVHPQVAINIAQWISPRFDVKVSGWVYEVMMTGKVDITQTKSYRELQRKNRGHKLRIQYLTKKYLKRQPRIEYKEKYVIYILTTELMKKERRYILGKAKDLTSRLSTYNKSDEHEVVYFQSCGDEETMNLVETMIFRHLREYREQANRERFILPEKEEIELFSCVVKKSVEFFKK